MLWTVNALEAAETELIVTQVLLFVEYCHDPLAESEVYAVMAIPAKVLALLPPLTVSALSLKQALNRPLTSVLVGVPGSSRSAAKVELPEATGASFTTVTVMPISDAVALNALEPPRAEASIVEPVVTVAEESINATVSLPGEPLKFAAGRNRILSPEATIRLVAAVREVGMLVQAPLAWYCQEPCAAVAALPMITTPASVLALDPPETASAVSVKDEEKTAVTVSPDGLASSEIDEKEPPVAAESNTLLLLKSPITNWPVAWLWVMKVGLPIEPPVSGLLRFQPVPSYATEPVDSS